MQRSSNVCCTVRGQGDLRSCGGTGGRQASANNGHRRPHPAANHQRRRGRILENEKIIARGNDKRGAPRGEWGYQTVPIALLMINISLPRGPRLGIVKYEYLKSALDILYTLYMIMIIMYNVCNI